MKHGNLLLYLASAGLLTQAATFAAGLLPMRSQRSAQHHLHGVEVAQSSLLQGKGTSAGGKWIYDGPAHDWWQRFCNVNFTGSVPKEAPVVPMQPPAPANHRRSIDQIIDLVSLAYDGTSNGKSGDTHVVIRYKPDADVHPPAEVLRALAHPLDMAASVIGAGRPKDTRTQRPPTPVPVASSNREILQLLRPGQHLWPGYQDIVLGEVSPDAESATFVRMATDAPAGTEPERMPLWKSTTRMSDEVRQALLDARKAAPATDARDGDHLAAGPSWSDVDETTREGNTWRIGRRDAADFGGDQSRLLEHVDFDAYQSRGSTLRGVQVRTVDARLGSSYGVAAGDVLESVNDQPVRNKAEMMNVIRKQYDLGVRTFRTKWLTATGQEVERVYQAPPGKRGG